MIIASKKNPTHHMLLLSFVSSCKVVTKVHSIPENLTYRITCCYYLLLASCKVVTKDHSMPEKPNTSHHMLLLSFVSSCNVYPSQTKIWEGGTKDEIMILEALCKGVSTRFGRRTIEKSVENPDFIFCNKQKFCSSFQNLRLGAIKLLQR
jgi:hypothetical protein